MGCHDSKFNKDFNKRKPIDKTQNFFGADAKKVEDLYIKNMLITIFE